MLCWVPPNSDQPGRSARGHYVIIVILTLMPDYNARAYDLLSVGTSISKDNLNLVCLLTRWGQPCILTLGFSRFGPH